MKDLLKIRNEKKSKKPIFTRQDNHKKPKLGNVWRRPKGLQSKMRLKKRGYKRSPEIGWGSPNLVKHLSKNGYKQNMIKTAKDIIALNPKTDGAIIGSTVGTKKRIELIKSLNEKKITILNIKDSAAYIAKVEKLSLDKKAEKLKLEKEKEKKGKEKVAKPKAEAEDLADLADEDKKKKEKAEKDKVLTKKE